MDDELASRAVIALMMTGCGVLMLWLARAAATGRLRRNAFAGIRIPSTMASDRAWLVGHRAARRPMQWAGGCALAAAVPALLPLPMDVVQTAVLVGCGAILACLLVAGWVARAAARADALTQQPDDEATGP